ncbi:MAG TPA: putative molybdenum carrier protein, partial [Methylomirabilota bacterium]|nr:putative molybdenum carrier protein [Methylomirabilota bacterium]
PEHELQASLEARTVANVHDAHATLVIHTGSPSPGTELTVDAAHKSGKALREIRLALPVSAGDISSAGEDIAQWIETVPGTTLNVGGPRESEAPLYWPARECLHHAFSILRARGLLPSASDADVETARFLRGEFVEVFRHWDTIRWQGPAWMSGIVTIAASLMASSAPKGWADIVASPLFAGLACMLMAFGAVCVVLQANLIAYHRRLQTELRTRLAALRLPPEQRPALRSELPFSFEGRRFWATASAWLLLYTNGLCVAVGAAVAYSLSLMSPFGLRHMPAVLAILAVELPLALLVWSLLRAGRGAITVPSRSPRSRARRAG